MTHPILFTAAVAIVYLFVRRPYFGMPLHVDSGFYVSCSTILGRRVLFARGWNAVHAGCSKVVPEYFYSVIYLFAGSTRYAYASRLIYSLYNYFAGIVAGLVLWRLTHSANGYYCGLLCYVLVSSEPQYGGYYESGEQFEPLFQVLGLLAALVGIQEGQPAWTGAGAALWTASAYFVKLSSIVGSIPLLATCAWLQPAGIPWILAGGMSATVLYSAWLWKNEVNPLDWIRGLCGHERAVGGTLNFEAIFVRFTHKLKVLGRAMLGRPAIPILAICGCFVRRTDSALVWACAMGALLTYLGQAARIRYYMLPVLVPMSIFSAGAATVALTLGPWGWAGIGGALLLWIAHHVAATRGRDSEALHSEIWRGDEAEEMALRSLQLHRVAQDLSAVIASELVLVYGPLTQAYLLCGTGYPLAMLAPNRWLDAMDPAWQAKLNSQLMLNPPRYILDTDHCFDAQSTDRGLGLIYQPVRDLGPAIQLYRHEGRSVGNQGDVICGAANQVPEASLNGVYTYAPRTWTDSTFEDAGLQRRLELLKQAGARRLGIYGAGRELLRHMEKIRSASLDIVAIFDDNPDRQGQIINGCTIEPLKKADPARFDVLLICSRTYAPTMVRRARRLAPRDLPLLVLDVAHS